MKKIISIALSSMLVGVFAANAAPAKSEKHAKDVTQYRQAIFQLVKSNVGVLGAMNKGAIPFDNQIMETNSLRLEQLSLMLEDYFATDTSGFDVDTGALDKVWKNESDFKAKISDFNLAAVNLNKVAKTEDTGQYKAAIGQVFKSCKGCHDSYKED